MKIGRLGEFGLIEVIRRSVPAKSAGVVAGIGDDAAVLRSNGRRSSLLLTTDTLVEGIHFSFDHATYRELGWKLAAVNISDIAAMGGVPGYALVTLGLKKDTSVEDVEDIYRGIKAISKRYGLIVVGGDIVSSPKAFFATMALTGSCDHPVMRSGARPGDKLMAVGRFGASSAGMRALKKFGRKALKISGVKDLAKAHLMPRPMIDEGLELSKVASSMIDNSDGLARSLIELSRAGGVGFDIYPDRIPLARGASINDALNGGEDYNLIFTVKRGARIPKGSIEIGRTTKVRRILTIDRAGRSKQLKETGFEHF